jgi:histidyl-tRNA synthetase
MSSKLTPKGMRDIPPEDMIIREQVIEKIRTAFRKYGFRPLETPAMEYMDTLRAKAGDEVDKQIFVIEGGEYGLRFDLTVPLARYAASSDSPKPFKRYAIERVWRKEEPQRGRFREFWQADVDIIGSKSMRCEAEVLAVARMVCLEFGFTRPKMLINNRKILDGVAAKRGFEDKKPTVFRILDKLDKIGPDSVHEMLKELLGEQKAGELVSLINTKGDNKKKIEIAGKYSEEGAKELEEIVALCSFEVTVDLSLVRGLGYYTGPVFEVKLAEDMGSVAGGGRYDNLLGVYGQPDCATGISLGIERLMTLMLEKEHGKAKSYSTVFVACAKPDFYKNAIETAESLRAEGIAAETDLNERNLRKQFDYCNALEIPYAIVIGEREVKSRKLTIRDMKSGKEEQLSLKDTIKRLKL